MKKFHFHLMESSSKELCNISEKVHCGKIITDEYAGETICNQCGVVLQEKTPSDLPELEKNDHSNETSSSSHMMTANTKYIGSSTTIGNARTFGVRDHTGKIIPKATRDMLNRLYNSGNIQRTGAKESQRNIASGVAKLDGLVHRLGLSENVCRDTIALYKNAHAARIVSGRSVVGVMSACLYYSCKKLGIPRDMEEICSAANIKKNTLFSCYREMVDSMELYCCFSEKRLDGKNNYGKRRYANNKNNYDYDNHVTKQRHIRCIPKIISKLNLPQRICRQAADLILLQDDYSLAGKNPKVVAATAIYLICRHDKKYNGLTQREMSEASGITEMSIRNLSKKIMIVTTKKEQ